VIQKSEWVQDTQGVRDKKLHLKHEYKKKLDAVARKYRSLTGTKRK